MRLLSYELTAATGCTRRSSSRRSLVSIALEDVGLARDERLRRVLHDYFAWATTTTMSRYHRSAEDVPDGLHIPKWSWDGRVG
jgi:hemoglobin